MRKWIVAGLMVVICLVLLTAASADDGFTVTETGMNEWTIFKNAGIMTRTSIAYNVLFNAAGTDPSKSITIKEVSSPIHLESCWVDYYGINFDGWQTDVTTNKDFYGSIEFSISEDVIQALECADYTINFTVSHNGRTATVPCLIHILDTPPKVPASVAGCEDSYTIRPDETITITPVIQPTDWAGNYLTVINFYAGKRDGSSMTYQLSSKEKKYAVKTGDDGEELLLYSCTDTSMSVTGKVPGHYKASISLYIPGTNAQYHLELPITVQNENGSSPSYVPAIYINIDGEFSGTNGFSNFYEAEKYKSDPAITINCFMDDYENTGVLNDLVEAEGLQPLEGQLILAGPNNQEYTYEINGYPPYPQPGYLDTGCTIILGDLPVGDYQGSLKMYWYKEPISIDMTLHRGKNQTGEPTGIAGINKLYILRPGEQITLPISATPASWTAPRKVYWYSSVYSLEDGEGSNVYYEDDSWRIYNGRHFTCKRTDGASGVTDIYTAKDSGFYQIYGTMQCADYEFSEYGYVLVLNNDGSTPSGAFDTYVAGAIATVSIPKGTTTIESEAFANTPDNAIVYFPASIETISSDAFSGVSGLVVMGYRNTAAQRFAQQNGYVFVPLQD